MTPVIPKMTYKYSNTVLCINKSTAVLLLVLGRMKSDSTLIHEHSSGSHLIITMYVMGECDGGRVGEGGVYWIQADT